MDTYRFFVPDLLQQSAGPAAGTRGILLPEDQAHHARTVLRLLPGDPVTLFDGHGASATGTLTGDPSAGGGKPSKNRPIEIKLHPGGGGIHIDPPPTPHLTIATAIPKGDRAEWLVDQVSQLNASTLHWLDCDRSVVKPKEGSAKLDKWRRLAIESAKQSHRTHLLHIQNPTPLQTLLAPLNTQHSSQILWLEPRTDNLSKHISQIPAAPNILALVGPEGGWSDREYTLLNTLADQQKLTRIQLTPTILRIETACTAIAALIMSR